MTTYSVTARSCNRLNVTVEIKELSIHMASFVFANLEKGFRNVEMLNEETGEVVKSIYYNGTEICPICSESEAIAIIGSILG